MTLPPLIDIGINLVHDSFDADRDAVLRRARGAGLVHLVVTGSTLPSSRGAAALAGAHPGFLSATAGVHPHHATELTAAELPKLRSLLEDPAIVAVGECGLDYFRDYSPREAQRAAFACQLDLAIAFGKPLFLHQREAHADFLAMLRERAASLPRAVAHCFTGSVAEAEAYLALGLSIGITGWICDERRGGHLREVVRIVPADRLMLETDGPYLLPRTLKPHPKSRRNEPMYLREVCRVVALARGDSTEQLALTTTAAARAFFAIDRSTPPHRSHE